MYLLADAEAYVNLGRAAEERFNDDWRIRGGVGYRLKYQWRFELLYTLMLSRDTLLDNFQTSNHILRLRIKFLPRHSPRQAIAARPATARATRLMARARGGTLLSSACFPPAPMLIIEQPCWGRAGIPCATCYVPMTTKVWRAGTGAHKNRRSCRPR